jgi:hypothetical protein
MNRLGLLHKRKSKYLGQTLNRFEIEIEPRIPKDVAERWKAIVREKFKALEEDAAGLIELDDKTELNGHAQAVRDTLDPRAGIGGNK